MKKMKIKLIITLLCLFHSLFAQLDYEKFTGEKGMITFDKEYSYVNLYDYQINASKEDSLITKKLSTTIPEGLLTDVYSEELLNNPKDSVTFEVRMKSRLLVDINTERICFIKYQTRSNSSMSNDKIFKAIRTESNWAALSNSTTEIQLLEQILQDTSVEMLFQFYNYNDNPEFEVINKLKPEVKDKKGVLNIKKLAEVINTNKAVLQKYYKE